MVSSGKSGRNRSADFAHCCSIFASFQRLEAINDVCRQQPGVFQTGIPGCSPSKKIVPADGMVPTQLNSRQYILPEIVLGGGGRCENLLMPAHRVTQARFNVFRPAMEAQFLGGLK